MVIGLDAAIPARWLQYAAKGVLPNFASLITRGVVAQKCHVPFPTVTPPNWTSLSTGASPAIHRITDFHVHTSGEPLNSVWQAFDESAVKAERLWAAWARGGASTILINYPGAWPPSVERGIQIGGHGLDTNEWRTRSEVGALASADRYVVSLAGADLISTAGDALASEPEARDASGWDDQPANALEFICPLSFRRARVPIRDARSWHILSYPGGIRVGFARDKGHVLAELAPGKWSAVLHETFETTEGSRDVCFRLKLLDHDHSAGLVRLFVTALCETAAGVHPPEFGEQLADLPGLPVPSAEIWEPYSLGWIGTETVLELEDMEHDRVAAAVERASEFLGDWSLLMLHDHGTDWLAHVLLDTLDPDFQPDASKRAVAQELELGLYQSLDRLIGRIVKVAGDDAVVVVVSDHGQVPSGLHFNSRVVLEDAGLLCYSEEVEDYHVDGLLVPFADIPDPEERRAVYFERRRVDWEHTRAIPQRSVYVYVNLRGRDPDGIVEPGEEYDAVCDRIIETLLTYVDPATGKRPVALALRRRDAQVLGLPDSDDIGDVVYAVNAPYGFGHAQHLPTVDHGIGSLNALFVMAGPGVKEGIEVARVVRLEDIAPTLSHLVGMPVPRDANGGLIFQALVEPDGPSAELRECREEREALRARNGQLERVSTAYQKSVAISHSYNESP